jgi:hypothetical protein
MGLPREDPAPSRATEVCPVWFATEGRVKNRFKLWLMDDRGELAVLPGRLRFHGRKTALDCREAREVGLVRQPVPWPGLLVTLVLSNAAILAMVYGGLMSTFTPDNPATFPVLIGINILFFMMNGPVRWVSVEYVGESGEPRRAYFVDGSAMGWGRLFGGTTRLYHKIRAAVTAGHLAG